MLRVPALVFFGDPTLWHYQALFLPSRQNALRSTLTDPQNITRDKRPQGRMRGAEGQTIKVNA